MNDEVKLILTKLKIVSEEKENGAYICDKEHSKILLSYIEQLRKKIDQYENPEDLTLFYIWLDTNTKDKMKQLQQENQQLKKQKDDVVENAKEKIKRYKSYINDLKNGNYPSPAVRQERQELIFRIKEQKDLLRMLGETDVED